MASQISPSSPCPCGTGDAFGECCQPVLTDPRQAATAEKLMRSRYTANVLRETEHLYRTWHPRTRPESGEATHTDWRGLRILEVEDGQPGDQRGEVEFQATWYDYRLRVPHERSEFVWRANRWMYVQALEDLSPPRWNNMKT